MQSSNEDGIVVSVKVDLVSTLALVFILLLTCATSVIPWYIIHYTGEDILFFPWGYVKISGRNDILGMLGSFKITLDTLPSKLFTTALTTLVSAFTKAVSKSTSRLIRKLATLLMFVSGILLLSSAFLFQYRMILELRRIQGIVLLYYGLPLAYISSISLMILAIKMPSRSTLYEITSLSNNHEDKLNLRQFIVTIRRFYLEVLKRLRSILGRELSILASRLKEYKVSDTLTEIRKEARGVVESTLSKVVTKENISLLSEKLRRFKNL